MSVPEIRRFDQESEFLIPEGCHIVELSNTTVDPDVSIARARVEPGVATEVHWLEGTWERYVILQGSGEVEIDDGPWEQRDLYHRHSKSLHYPRTVVFNADLKPGKHVLRLRVAQGAAPERSAMRILQFVAN